MTTEEPVHGGFERLCRELLAEAYPEADARWLDEHTASALAAADRAVAMADLRADAARQEIRAAVLELLGRLRGRDFSPDALAAEVETEAVKLTATARPAGPRFAVTLRAESATLAVGELAGLWLAARATGPRAARLPVRYLAQFTAQGVAVFSNVPAGRWTFDLLTHSSPGDRPGAYPMPSVRTDVAAAATGSYAVATPDGALFVLHDLAGESPTLEITAPDGRPRLVPIRYRDRTGTAHRILVALAPADTGPASSRVDLPGFSPDSPWEAGPFLDEDAIASADARLVADSVRATRDRATLRAWRSVAKVVPELAGVIAKALPRP
ncbi:hypothetical protein ABGB17_13445 [Sphaerisporangium sp. B11E5]|uniref:hypothetical protein n=1 Tax=Sphaerisporangium sp. B11E5 TaxID=3153563 RepID=UPI00325C9D82